MLNKTLWMIASCMLVGAIEAGAQTLCANNSSKLGCLIPTLYGPSGLTLPNPTHNAHFDSDFQSNFSPVNNALASQLTLLPLVSPAPVLPMRSTPRRAFILDRPRVSVLS